MCGTAALGCPCAQVYRATVSPLLIPCPITKAGEPVSNPPHAPPQSAVIRDAFTCAVSAYRNFPINIVDIFDRAPAEAISIPAQCNRFGDDHRSQQVPAAIEVPRRMLPLAGYLIAIIFSKS